MKALAEVLESIDAAVLKHKDVTMVFDLDSTIFCVSPRTQFIMRQFPASDLSKIYSVSHLEALRKLESIETKPTDWGMKSALVRHGVFAQIDFFEALRDYWALHFFSNDHLDRDIPYDGVIEFVKSCYQRGAKIRYLTGRDTTRMGQGSIRQIRSHGLPLDQDSDLQMKENIGEADTKYKAEYFNSFSSKDLESTWFFENEPWILRAVKAEHSALNVVFSDTVHSGREEPDPSWPKVGFDWALYQ